jgi:hypothetical protein
LNSKSPKGFFLEPEIALCRQDSKPHWVFLVGIFEVGRLIPFSSAGKYCN